MRLPQDRLARLRERVRTGRAGIIALAVVVGAGAGVGAVVFRYLILWFTRIFSGTDDPSAGLPAAHPWLPFLGVGFVVLAPAAGGLIYGPLITRFAREARGHGVPEVMLAVAERGGRIRPQVALVKSLASAICIGSGGSVGREGPIVQIGAALGSSIGQLLRVSQPRLRLLVACGAAAGIAATFNAPIAGVLFALELILRDFESESFGAVVIASVMANVIGRAAFGSQAFLALPAFELVSLWEFGLYVGLGVLAGAAGVLFVRVLYGTEDLYDRLWRGRPEWLRPGVGGLGLGVLLLLIPQMWGVGYPVLENAITGEYAIALLLLFLVGKIAATSISIAMGGSGGVFAPSLFMGAMLGTAYGEIARLTVPIGIGSAGAYGLVGMGALFAGAARAPMTAVIIIFELTGEYTIILPLMTAIVVAVAISALLSRDTIYTLKLWRRGIEFIRPRVDPMQELRVRDAMRPTPPALRPNTPFTRVVETIGRGPWDALPVVDESGGFLGVVTSHAIEDASRSETEGLRAEDLLVEVPVVEAADRLERALGALMHEGTSGVAVVDGEMGRVVGWLTHRDVLRAYGERLGVRRTSRTASASNQTPSAT